jgi:amidase
LDDWGVRASARFEFEEATIDQLQRRMGSGEVTSRTLVDAYLDRIRTIDHRGPGLRAVLEINPDARRQADALDRERRVSGPRGPLHGIPVLVKDNIDTADRTQTTAGSLALQGVPTPNDAPLIEHLRKVGAVLLGKTNLSEWSGYRGIRTIEGWSARGGVTRNPYALDRTASGSSSGSATAVSANLCAVAVGTETGGSIVAPCSCTGVVGIKPTVGLISRTGIIPISTTQDTAGAIGRTVRDAALLLDAMAGADPEDAATLHRPPGVRCSTGLTADALQGARLGVARGVTWPDPATDLVFEQTLRLLSRQGAKLVTVRMRDAAEMHALDGVVLNHELKVSLGRYLSRRRPDSRIRTLAGLIAFNRSHTLTELKWCGQELFLAAQATRGLSAPAYRRALARCRTLSRGFIDGALSQHRLDALLCPASAPAVPIDAVHGDRYMRGGAGPAAIAGYPSVTVPMGYVHGLPVGVLFFGTRWRDPALVRLAFAYERASLCRRAPELKPTVARLDPATPRWRAQH